MKEFFGYDGWLLRILSKMGELIILNLIFLVCCIPLVTVGPALTSLYYTVVKCIRRDCGSPAKEFFLSMKRVMGRGILYTVVLAAWTALLILIRDYGNAADTTVKPVVYVCDILLILTTAFAAYIFPVLSRFEVKTGKMIRLAIAMSVRYVYFTIVIAGGTLALIYIMISGIIPAPCILFLPAFWCFAVSFMMEQALLAYMPAPQENETAWYYPVKDPEREAAKAEKREKRLAARAQADRMKEERRAKERGRGR